MTTNQLLRIFLSEDTIFSAKNLGLILPIRNPPYIARLLN